jgi:hypothetical protein
LPQGKTYYRKKNWRQIYPISTNRISIIVSSRESHNGKVKREKTGLLIVDMAPENTDKKLWQAIGIVISSRSKLRLPRAKTLVQAAPSRQQ